MRINFRRASKRVHLSVALVAAMLLVAAFLARPAQVLGAAALPAVAATVHIGAGLQQGAARSAEANPPAIAAGQITAPNGTAGCGKSIDVNLTGERLVASECGRPVLTTAITSGRAGLRTPTGTFQIFLKEQNVYFNSPWPQGDPNYYPPMFVAYALEFLDGGYFLHTDPDEPDASFGAGSQDGQYASHGCVHVPFSVMVSLYSWAAEGTQVNIHY